MEETECKDLVPAAEEKNCPLPDSELEEALLFYDQPTTMSGTEF